MALSEFVDHDEHRHAGLMVNLIPGARNFWRSWPSRQSGELVRAYALGGCSSPIQSSSPP